MKQTLSFLIVIILIVASCKNKTDNNEVQTADVTKTDTTNAFFYPISQYVEGQLAYVDSMPLAIEKHTYVNNKRTDSVIIDRQTLKQLATDFYKPDIMEASLKPLYTATQFNDLTINTLTFSYNANQADLPIQQRDILLVPETQKVKNMMFRKIEHRGDTTVTINGLWVNNMNFQINYIIEPSDGPLQTKQIRVIWDRPIVRAGSD